MDIRQKLPGQRDETCIRFNPEKLQVGWRKNKPLSLWHKVYVRALYLGSSFGELFRLAGENIGVCRKAFNGHGKIGKKQKSQLQTVLGVEEDFFDISEWGEIFAPAPAHAKGTYSKAWEGRYMDSHSLKIRLAMIGIHYSCLDGILGIHRQTVNDSFHRPFFYIPKGTRDKLVEISGLTVEDIRYGISDECMFSSVFLSPESIKVIKEKNYRAF